MLRPRPDSPFAWHSKSTSSLAVGALLFAALAATLTLAACDTGGGPAPADPPRALTAQEQAVADAAGQDFGLRLFRKVNAAEEGENVFLSPLSVSMALGMTMGGAEGATRAAMEETLALNGLSQQEINESYQSLIDLLAGLDPKVRFSLANSIWYRSTFTVEQPFIDTNKKYFDAEVAALDFGNGEAAGTINGWVSDQTEGKIEKIVKPPIPRNVMMYLINAIYFKGDWTYQFDENKTKKAPFTLSGGTEKTVDMMKQPKPTFASYQGETLAAVDLPYGDSLYTMTVLVPRGERSADSLAAGLDAERWQAVTEGLREGRKVGVALPRFELEYGKTLNEMLKAMGMEEAFIPSQSDFSGINKKAGKRLYISEVKHKSFVKVNEEGTEAAAATSVGIGTTSGGSPPVVRADRPFLFVIRENHSGTILFVGKVGDPTA